MKKASSLLLKLFGLGAVLLSWRYVSRHQFSWFWSVVIVWGFVAFAPLAAAIARKLLDREPTPEHAATVSVTLHYCLGILLGCALIVGFQFTQEYPIIALHVSHSVVRPFMLLFGVCATLTILNLLIQGLGLPFAAKESSRLVTGWLYKHCRNPMGLFSILFVAAAALWLQSLHALVWAVLWFAPAWVLFVKFYEERELEVRYGKPYLEYKSRTPFFL